MKLHPLSEAALVSLTRQCYPREAAGLVVASAKARWPEDERAFFVTRFPGDASSHPRRFRVDPLDWLQHESDAAALDLEVRGYWHSHPTASPTPSRHDLETVHDLGAGAAHWIFAIVGLSERDDYALRVFAHAEMLAELERR